MTAAAGEHYKRPESVLVVVYTGNSHLQLHNCTGYVLSEELGEVTFVAETEKRLSGLVVERGASCSMYASLNRDLISSDFLVDPPLEDQRPR